MNESAGRIVTSAGRVLGAASGTMADVPVKSFLNGRLYSFSVYWHGFWPPSGDSIVSSSGRFFFPAESVCYGTSRSERVREAGDLLLSPRAGQSPVSCRNSERFVPLNTNGCLGAPKSLAFSSVRRGFFLFRLNELTAHSNNIFRPLLDSAHALSSFICLNFWRQRGQLCGCKTRISRRAIDGRSSTGKNGRSYVHHTNKTASVNT